MMINPKGMTPNNDGFSLAELLIAASILIFVFAGVLLTFIRCSQLESITRNYTTSLLVTKNRMAQIKNSAFNQISLNYNGTTFATGGVDGIGVSYIDSTNPDLYQVVITFCWQEQNGRVFGEDLNLNGQLDVGEDQNGNGRLDSPVQIISSLYNV